MSRFRSRPSAMWKRSRRSQSAHKSKAPLDRKSTRLNSSHVAISYAVFCLKKKKNDSGMGEGRGGGPRRSGGAAEAGRCGGIGRAAGRGPGLRSWRAQVTDKGGLHNTAALY